MQNQDTFTGPSFSLLNRIKRTTWQLVDAIFFKSSLRPLHKWRAFLLRCFGAKVARGTHAYPGVEIWAPWNLELGEECGIASGVILYSMDTIKIGKRSVISQGTHLCAGTHDYTKPGFPLIAKPITIGDHVWIAAEAFIHPGVTIGDGCVIGARSVVTHDMPAWMVCAGHPCKPIKERVFEHQR